MRTLLSWHNTFHNWKRALAATAGIAFAVLLIFMEVGFLDAARINAAQLYEGLEFDAVIVSKGYVSAQRTLPISAYRLLQAGNVPGVDATLPLLIETARWMNVEERRSRSCRVLGVDPTQSPFRDPAIAAQLDAIQRPNTLLVDRLSSHKYGAWEPGGRVYINDAPLTVIGEFAMGTGLISDGGVIVSRETFQEIVGRGADQGYDVGLVRIGADADAGQVVEAIRAELPDDVLVLSRREIIEREQFFWVNVKPVGIMFRVGAMVAFIIGAVILYQVLALEIGNRLNEFATLKAMGYAPQYLYRIGAEQALIYALLGYLPAFVLALGLYALVYRLSRLPLYMDAGRAGMVLLLTLTMATAAAALALRKLHQADPAELF
jgi:putative ABC transport system permease protein